MQYKDDRPENTCSRVIEVLGNKYGLTFKSAQSNSGEVCPSYGLMNKEMVMFTNGKGVSSEYALASAYGEMCERLFNLCSVRLDNTTIEDMGIVSNFFERYERKEVYRELDRFVTAETGSTDNKELVEAMLRYVDMCTWPRETDLLNCISYAKESGDKFIIPYVLSDILLGTNGMAAGNSYEEAYVQAFCELIERKAIKDLCEGKAVPKKVAQKDLSGSELWKKTLDVIAAKEDELEIEAYTFEAVYDFPVAFVLLTNHKAGYVKYKFGAHFNIACAVERCITEMVQGAELTDYTKWQRISEIEGKKEAEILLIFKDGSGMISADAYKNVLKSKDFFLSKWEETSSKGAYNKVSNRDDNVYVHKSVSNPLHVLQLYIPQWSIIVWLTTKEWEARRRETEVARYLKYAMDCSDRNSCEEFAKKAKAMYRDETTLAEIARCVCPVEKQYLKNLTLGEYVDNIERFYTENENKIPLNYCAKCVRHNMDDCIVNKRKNFCRGFYDAETIT